MGTELTRRDRARSLGVLAAAVALGAACHAGGLDASMSLDEARKVAAGLENTAPLVPPPRSAVDVLAELRRAQRSTAELQELLARADAVPPANLAGTAHSRFFAERAGAAIALGRVRQALDDLHASLATADAQRRSSLIFLVKDTEYRAGHFTRALDASMEYIALIEDLDGTHSGRAISAYGSAAALNAELGDSRAAASFARKMDVAFVSQAPRPTGMRNDAALLNKWGSHQESTVNMHRARMLNAQGRYREAEAAARLALSGHELSAKRSGNRFDQYQWLYEGDAKRLQLARALIGGGRPVEAEIEARRVLTDVLGRTGRESIETAEVLVLLGRAVFDQGRVEDAQRLAEAALDIYRAIRADPDSVFVARAREQLADTLFMQDRWAEASQVYREMLDRADRAAIRGGVLAGNVNFALTLIQLGARPEAEAVADEALAKASRVSLERHYALAEARAIRALAGVGQGAAGPELIAAVRDLLAFSVAPDDSGASGAAQRQRRRLIVEGYLRAVSMEPGGTPADVAAETFRMADAVRGGAVQAALAAAAARGMARDSELASLIRSEQDARQHLSALHGLLAVRLTMADGDRETSATESLRAAAGRARAAHAALLLEIERRFPDYASLVDPKPATIAQVRGVLRAGEALVAFYVASDRTYVWAVPRQGEPRFAVAALGRAEIDAAVRRLRAALDPGATTLEEIPAFDVAGAHALYARLLKPVEAAWASAASLLVVPHGALAQLPFGVLVTDGGEASRRGGEPLFAEYGRVAWLIRRVAVAHLPAVTSLVALRALPPGDAQRRPFIGFGDPWFNAEQARRAKLGGAPSAGRAVGVDGSRAGPVQLRAGSPAATLATADIGALPRLPETADELRRVARALGADPERDVFTGAAASERTVRNTAMGDRRVVMFATHGLVPGEIDGLTQPALALSAPSVTLEPGDGLLTVAKILGLKLDADWVVLSACNTAAADGAGAEAVSGLGRAFFYAGSRAVLVSHWPVHSEAAMALTTDAFRRQAAEPSLSRAEALRRAEIALIDGSGARGDAGRRTFSYAHPLFWAPFTLVGDGG